MKQVLHVNRECMQLTSCTVISADCVTVYDVLLHTCMAVVKSVVLIVVEA